MHYTLRDLQLCEFSILNDIDRVCSEHRITYYLSSGTLLGALRHKGFIPWDDDIDIEMPYKEYLRFVEIAQDALGEGYFVQNHNTDKDFNRFYTKIRKNGTTLLSKYEIGLPGHHGVWIDVFPIISIGGKLDYQFKKTCVRIGNFLAMDEVHFRSDSVWLRQQSGPVLFSVVKAVRHLPHGIREALFRLSARLSFAGHDRKTKRKGHIWNSITYIHPAEVFQGAPKKLSFEGGSFPVPPLYEEYLRNAYGDYMKLPPEDKRSGRHGDMIIDLSHSWERYFQKADSKAGEQHE